MLILDKDELEPSLYFWEHKLDWEKTGFVYYVIRVTTIPLLPRSTSEAMEEKTDGIYSAAGGAGSILGDIWRLVYPVTDLCAQIYERWFKIKFAC